MASLLEHPLFLEIESDYTTFASTLPHRRYGNVELQWYEEDSKSYYRMEGVDGYFYYHPRSKIKLTQLVIDNQVWMVDDPLHWRGMQALARASHGNVLVAGLGLGLVTSELKKNKRVCNIDVIEREPDLIELIGPKLRESGSCNIRQGNFWRYLEKLSNPRKYDTVILDLYVRSQDKPTTINHTVGDLLSGYYGVKTIMPSASVFVWGLRDPEINPAVKLTKDVIYAIASERVIGSSKLRG